jgi:hypothetical protein
MASALLNPQGQVRSLSLSVFNQYNCDSLQLGCLLVTNGIQFKRTIPTMTASTATTTPTFRAGLISDFCITLTKARSSVLASLR